MEHSQTPWRFHGANSYCIWTADGEYVAALSTGIAHQTINANGARIVACVNACASLPNPAEDIPALIEALKRAFNILREAGFVSGLIEDEYNGAMKTIEAILAKVQP